MYILPIDTTDGGAMIDLDELHKTLGYQAETGEEPQRAYDLSVDSRGNPVITMDRVVWNRLWDGDIDRENLNKWVAGVSAGRNLPQFMPIAAGRWGFGPVMEPFRVRDGRIAFRIRYPRSPNRHELDWKGFYAAALTLHVLFSRLQDCEPPKGEDKKQLLTITGFAPGDRCDVSYSFISAQVSPQMCRWVKDRGLSAQGQFGLEPVKRAMRRVYAHLVSGYLERFYYTGWGLSFRAELEEPKWIYLTVPGSCACLGRGHRDAEDDIPDHSYALTPHNTDSSLQILTMLVGLCVLNQLARADGY